MVQSVIAICMKTQHTKLFLLRVLSINVIKLNQMKLNQNINNVPYKGALLSCIKKIKKNKKWNNIIFVMLIISLRIL